jgi:hypothetical protein
LGSPERTGIPQSFHSPPEKERLKFDSDYDFEKANEQFHETLEKLKEEKTEEKKDIGSMTELKSVASEEKKLMENSEHKPANENNAEEKSNDEEEKKDDIPEGDSDDSDSESSTDESDNESASGNSDASSQTEEKSTPPAVKKEEEPIYYDKKNSFFDSISSEMLEREGRVHVVRMDWKKQRLVNQETFGYNAVRSMVPPLRRGGGSGGGYNRASSNINYSLNTRGRGGGAQRKAGPRMDGRR